MSSGGRHGLWRQRGGLAGRTGGAGTHTILSRGALVGKGAKVLVAEARIGHRARGSIFLQAEYSAFVLYF